jgi:ectoine hydroxylase-related dioxygenase (phytanoyl-CoA dioxygenase family)
MKIITYRQFDNAIKKQVADNIEKYGKSYAESTIEDSCKDIILCIRQDEKRIEVIDNWKEEIKKKGIIEE